MTDMQLYPSIGLPTILILIGLLLNWTATKDVGNLVGVIESDMR